jgi:predicted membrane protein
MKFKPSKLIWGILLLLAATFVLLNQFGYFTGIGIVNIIIAALAVAFFVHCIVRLHFSLLPIPLAILYIFLQKPLELPYIQTWALVISAILMVIGLAVLFPRKWKKNHVQHNYSEDKSSQKSTENGKNDNNPSISVNFGVLSRHLYADCLEIAHLRSNFGELEVFFDNVELSPKGAEAIINSNCGAIKLYIPKHWRIIDRLNCTLGAVELDARFANPADDAPQITLIGSVSLGEITVRYI